jgi:hypothetical protein
MFDCDVKLSAIGGGDVVLARVAFEHNVDQSSGEIATRR